MNCGAKPGAFGPCARALAVALAAGLSLAAASGAPFAPLPSLPGFGPLMLMAPLRLWAALQPTALRWPDAEIAAYAGGSYTPPSDVHLHQPGGTELTLEQVPWRGEPFKAPIYYGLRAAWWALAGGRLGLMIDFTHIKAEAIGEARVRQSGTRDGRPVPPEERVDVTFDDLEFSHGFNVVTLNALLRPIVAGRLTPYAGIGLGFAVNHFEILRQDAPKTQQTFEYQPTGPAVQILAGARWRPLRRLSLFVEYKLTCAVNAARLRGGGRLRADLCTHQLLGGPILHVGTPSAPAIN